MPGGSLAFFFVTRQKNKYRAWNNGSTFGGDEGKSTRPAGSSFSDARGDSFNKLIHSLLSGLPVEFMQVSHEANKFNRLRGCGSLKIIIVIRTLI
jgi:hypothetical protein